MPRKIKPKKEETFVPLNKKDLERAVEIPVKEVPLEKIEIIEKQSKRSAAKFKANLKEKAKEKKSSGRKTSTRFAKTRREVIQKEESPVKTSSKNGKGYILIITEKPAAAMKIAYALDDNHYPRKLNIAGVPYYELTRENKKIVVSCAVGHLFTLAQSEKTKKTGWPVFDIHWRPNFEVRKEDFTKKYYTALKTLARGAESFIVATDYDVEGEVIGWNVVRFIANQVDAKRMKFSALTSSELQEAYNNLMPHVDFGQAYAGETRHYLDWMYGINLSRALMSAIKAAGSFRIMSIGRVQGPALKLIVDKERSIQDFKPMPYWDIFIYVSQEESNVKNLELKYIKDITKKEELDKFKGLKGKTGIAKTDKFSQTIKPLAPFDLTTLQMEAYSFFGITPSRTLQIAQQLYLEGLISYPRTSSQKLPSSLLYDKILEKLKKQYPQLVKFAVKKQPIEGKKSDPAHPAIHPTGESSYNLSGENEKIYELIVKRFIACFADDALIENKKISVKAEGNDNLIFNTRGMQIRKEGWMRVYPTKMSEKELPDLNGEVNIDDLKFEEKMTQPPKRYSPASIVSELSKRNLGTKSTRASIVETLYDRGYIQGKSIEATALGISLIKTLEKYSPVIIDEQLTRHFEKEMDELQKSKNQKQKEEQVLDEAKKVLIEISDDFKKKEKKIGEELVNANNNLREQQKKDNELMECPVCHKGKLAITYSKRNGRFFVACNSYPLCRTTFSLPPNGSIKKVNKLCEKCNFPLMMRLSKGKRPWIFCFNPNCETRREREEKREENAEQESE
jgi:DNA topoisomerase-1